MASTVLDDPSGYGRVVRDEHGAVERVVETKAAGDATPEQLRIREVNTGIYVFAADALREALPRLSADNAQGELYLPQALDLICAPTAGRSRRTRSTTRGSCSASTTGRRSRTCASWRRRRSTRGTWRRA